MIKLRKILLSNKLYIIIFIISLSLALIRVNLNKFTYQSTFKGTVKSIKYEDDKITIRLKKGIVKYYVKDKDELDYFKTNLKIGYHISGFGKSLKKTSKNGAYFTYLKKNNINKVITAADIKIVPRRLVIYQIKEFFINRCEKLDKKNYLKALVIGHNEVDKDQKKVYQKIGISHLLAISGTHITVLTTLLMFSLKLLKNEDYRYLIVIIFLICFAFLSSFASSLIRSASFYILRAINKIFYFNISIMNIFMLALSLLIFINPFLIYNIGFLYSSLISFFLIYYSDYLEGTFFKVLIKTSFIAFLASFPLTIYLNSSINPLTIIFNLFFVSFMSYILFPLALLKFILPVLPFNFFVTVFELTASLCDKIDSSFIVKKPSLIFIYLLYLFLYLAKKKKIYYYLFIFLFFIIYISKYFTRPSITFFDVGNGDAALISLKNVNIIVDVAGSSPPKIDKTYKKYSNGEKIASYLKKEGIKEIDFVIISHGDFDHIGGVIDLAENIKVKEVILNNDTFNNNEQRLIKYLHNKKIEYRQNINKITIKHQDFFFLNNKIYDNENDNSLILYFNYLHYKFLFMGDASKKAEEELINNYNIQNIDILKVGHHGSHTSSSKKFIEAINPKISVISVGLNNKFGHPGKWTLFNLRKTKIYRTDEDGCIKFRILKNNIKDTLCNY